jgi:hypothetical protein
MSSNFINIWAECGQRIIEKANLRITTIEGKPAICGTYYSTNPVYFRNHQLVASGVHTEWIKRKFETFDDAEYHLKLSCEEFIEKYPKYKGSTRFGDKFTFNGQEISKEIQKVA